MAVTVARGKTHSRFARILVGGANLSGDARTLGGVGLTYAQADVTAWADGITTFLMGIPDAQLGPFSALFSNLAAGTGPVEPGTHTVLASTGSPIVTAVLGMGAAPTIGAPAFSLYTTQLSYTVAPAVGDALAIEANFSASSGNMEARPGWGQVLAVGASISSTSSLGSLDNGAATSNGAIGVLHLTTSAGAMGSNDWEIKIESSTNDSDWNDLIIFDADGSAVAAEWDDTSATGTIPRYTRVTATKTAGTDIVIWVNLIRL